MPIMYHGDQSREQLISSSVCKLISLQILAILTNLVINSKVFDILFVAFLEE